MTPKTMRCDRCSKRYRGSGEWNFTMHAGVAVGMLCPTCQTPQENAEAIINEATLVYGRLPDGRAVGRLRG